MVDYWREREEILREIKFFLIKFFNIIEVLGDYIRVINHTSPSPSILLGVINLSSPTPSVGTCWDPLGPLGTRWNPLGPVGTRLELCTDLPLG